MANLVVALQALEPWTREGMRSASDAHIARLENVIAQEDRLHKVQLVMLAQRVALDTADLAWDAIGWLGALKKLETIAKGNLAEDEVIDALLRNPRWNSPGLELNNLLADGVAYADALTSIAQRWNNQILADGGDPKSHALYNGVLEGIDRMVAATDLAQKLHESSLTGEKAYRRANLAALFEPAFQILKWVAEQAEKELQDRKAELEQVLSAEERALTAGFVDRVRLGERLDLHVEAVAEAETARLSLMRAFRVAGTPGAAMPEGSPVTWGEALRLWLPELATRATAAEKAVDALTVRAGGEPTLTLSAQTFRPGADIKVVYDVPASIATRAWIGLHRATDPHGSEADNAVCKLVLQSIPQPLPGKQSQGELTFKAPEEGGSYDLRLNSAQTGREHQCVKFRVSNAGEGTRLAFGESMAQYSPTASSLTLPEAAPGEHVEYPLDIVAESEEDGPASGLSATVRTLDSAGRETQGGPRVRGRYGLVSDYVGRVTAGGRMPVVFNIPAGTWTIEFSSADAENVLTVKCRCGSDGGVHISGEGWVEPERVNTGWKDDTRRTVSVSGWLNGLPRDGLNTRYKLQAYVPGSVGALRWGGASEAASDKWVDVRLTQSQCYLFSLVVKYSTTNKRQYPAVNLRVYDTEKQKSTWDSAHSFETYYVPEGCGGVRVVARDPLANEISKLWKLHHASGKIDGKVQPRGITHFIPAGSFDVSYDTRYCREWNEKWLRGRRVTEGDEITVEIRDTTGIIDARVLGTDGRPDGLIGDVTLYYEKPTSGEPERKYIGHFLTWSNKQTPTGLDTAETYYAECAPGDYIVHFVTERRDGLYRHEEWLPVTVTAGGWVTLNLQGR